MSRLAQILSGPLRRRWQRWLQRRHPRGTVQLLSQQRVYIFLSRGGLAFCVMLLAMLGGAINYDLALAYLLVFLLGALALVSLFHTFRNLLGLRLQAGRVEACFAGESARFELLLDNRSALARQALRLRYAEAEVQHDVPAHDALHVWLSVPARQRGWLAAPHLAIETDWPLGIFRSWSYAWLEQRVLVYPQAEPAAPPLPAASAGNGQGRSTARGQDDFAGLRPYQRGDSPRHVAWKAAARDEGLMVKQFHGEAADALWLDWDSLPPGLAVEARLSRLCAWVLAAHAAGLAFGLLLPGQRLPPAAGDGQREACLAALALFGSKADA